MKFRTSGIAAGLGLLAAIWGGPLAAQEVVYDNTANVMPVFYRFSREHGDEIELGGTARRVTEFLFQYSGDFATNAPADLKIRFYANDGEPSFAGHPSALAPHTVLWESDWQRMAPGPQVVVLSLPDVLVPERFTWTVQFRGVVGSVGNAAGLILADPPTLGAPLADGKIGSYWDAWIRNPMGPGGPEWGLINFGFKPGDAKANFFARLTAVPDPVVAPLVVRRPSGAMIRWPTRAGRTYHLEVADEFPPRAWRLVEERVGDGGLAEYQEPDPGGARFFRVREVEPLTVLRLASGRTLRWATRAGRYYQLEVSDEWPAREWQVRGQVQGDGGLAFFSDPDDPAQRFYRVREVDQPRLEALTVTQAGNATLLDWGAEPGRRYVIEYRAHPGAGWKLLDRPRPPGSAARHQDPEGQPGSTREYRVWLER